MCTSLSSCNNCCFPQFIVEGISSFSSYLVKNCFPTFEIPDNPLLGRVQINWKDCIILTGLVITVVSAIATFFTGQIFWASALLVASIGQGMALYYLKKNETNLTNTLGNLSDINNELRERSLELQRTEHEFGIQIGDLRQQNSNLRKTNSLLEENVNNFRRANEQLEKHVDDLKKEILDLHNIDRSLEQRIEALKNIEEQIKKRTLEVSSLNTRYQTLLELHERQNQILDQELFELTEIRIDFQKEVDRLEKVRNDLRIEWEQLQKARQENKNLEQRKNQPNKERV